MKLHGIYVPTVVPLRKNGSLNEEELSRHIVWLANKGVDGIYANGSTGEFTRFTQEERRRTIEIVAQARVVHLFIAGRFYRGKLTIWDFCGNVSCYSFL